jgi:hypothetical protein
VHQNPLINIEAAPGDENIDEEFEEANIEAGGTAAPQCVADEDENIPFIIEQLQDEERELDEAMNADSSDDDDDDVLEEWVSSDFSHLVVDDESSVPSDCRENEIVLELDRLEGHIISRLDARLVGLLGRDLQPGLGELLRGREYFSRIIWHASSRSVLDRLLIAVIGLLQVATEGEHSTESWHLKKQIDIMRHCHEFGECRSTQYCMVRRVKSSHFELDEFSMIILPRTEGDREDHRTERMRRITWDDAVERGLAGNQHILEIQTHLLQSADEDEIEPAPAIDQDLGKLNLRYHGVQDQGKLTGLGKACPLVITRERDGDLRPTKWPRYRRLDGQNLSEEQLLIPPGTEVLVPPEDDVDHLQRILKLRVAPVILLIIVLGFFVSRLLVLPPTTGVAERPPKVVAVDGSVVGARMPRALLLQELLELLLSCRLLTS